MIVASDPLITWRLRRRIVVGVGIAFTLLAATWCFWPLGDSAAPGHAALIVPQRQRVSQEDAAQLTLDPKVFARAGLWNPLDPPPPPPPEVGGEREQRITVRPVLELIGIILEDRRYLAAIYRPNDGELLIVASGDRIEPYIVSSVTEYEVVLEDGPAIARLSTRRDEGSSRQ